METYSTSSNAMLDFARLFIKAGYGITPLNGKTPILTNWVNCPMDLSTLNLSSGQNYGVVLTENDLVIDIDPRRFPDGRDIFKEFCAHFGVESLNSFTVRTGGGGLHIYLKKPKEVKIKGSLREFPGIEFKTKGQQVVGPACIHPETNKKYYPLKYLPGETIQVSTQLLNCIDKTQNESFYLKQVHDYQDDDQTKERYSGFLKNIPGAVEGQEGDKTTYLTACKGRDLGLSPGATLSLMLSFWNNKCVPPWAPDQLTTKVYNAYRYANGGIGSENPVAEFSPIEGVKQILKESGMKHIIKIRWETRQNGERKHTLGNTLNFFLLEDSPFYDCLQFNLFSKQIEFKRPMPWHTFHSGDLTWTDADAVNIAYWLSSVKQYNIHSNMVHDAALVISKAESYHPIKRYLEALKWDGVPRLDSWLSTYCKAEDNEYTRAIGMKVLVAAVARIYNPGVTFQYMLVLEGAQGLGKSAVCKIMGGDYYGEIFMDVFNKDVIDIMHGKWVIELAEMQALGKTTVEAMKGFLSRDIDRARLAYARNAENFPRQCIFIGTVNPDGAGYLKDTTGNRRYWVVSVGRVNRKALTKDRNQIFAEAVERYKNGEKLYLDKDKLESMAVQEQRLRTVDDPWANEIVCFLQKSNKEGRPIDAMSVGNIYVNILNGYLKSLNKSDSRRISQIMACLGWGKGRVKSSLSGEREYCFLNPLSIEGSGYENLIKPEDF